MPVGSDPLPLLPQTWRPLGARVVGTVVTVGLVAICATSWVTFDDETRAKFTLFQQLTLLLIGGLIVAVLYALLRSCAVAHRDGLTVINGYKRREFEWAQIVAVQMPPGAPWVTLDLADGNVASVMGIQSSDGERARRAVRELRALVAAASAQ